MQSLFWIIVECTTLLCFVLYIPCVGAVELTFLSSLQKILLCCKTFSNITDTSWTTQMVCFVIQSYSTQDFLFPVYNIAIAIYMYVIVNQANPVAGHHSIMLCSHLTFFEQSIPFELLKVQLTCRFQLGIVTPNYNVQY